MKIKVIENRKRQFNVANNLLPNLLEKKELEKFNGGLTFCISVNGCNSGVTCGSGYSLQVCNNAHTACGSNYIYGDISCSGYSNKETCWGYK